MEKLLKVGIGDMKLTRGEGVIITYALGSCIGISVYDPVIRLGGLLHIMLPVRQNEQDLNVYKYADTGIREMLRKLGTFGLVRSRAEVKIAGGAKMFEMTAGSTIGDIGQRNIRSVEQILRREGYRIMGEDVGSNYARTMSLDVATGVVRIRTFGHKEVLL